MEKEYITPKIKVRKVELESLLVDPSLNKDNPTTGLPGGNDPTSGGTATGGNAGGAGSKVNLWTTDED